MTIKVYELCGANPEHLFSPHCWKVRMALAHKGLQWDVIPTPFTGVATIESGESRRVPVIRDADTIVEESFEIAKYLETSYPQAPTLFNGPGGEALTQHIISWSQTKLHSEIAKLAMLDIHNALAPEKMVGCTLEEFDTKFPKNGESLMKALHPLEVTLKQQPFIGGDTPLFADYVVFGALQWLRTCSDEAYLPQDNAVAAWFNTLLDLYDGVGRQAIVAR